MKAIFIRAGVALSLLTAIAFGSQSVWHMFMYYSEKQSVDMHFNGLRSLQAELNGSVAEVRLAQSKLSWALAKLDSEKTEIVVNGALAVGIPALLGALWSLLGWIIWGRSFFERSP